MKILDIEKIKLKFIDTLNESGWSTLLKSFIHSEDFTKIISELYKLREDGKRFTPQLKYVFKAFEDCSFDNTRVVILGNDPYPEFDIANGVAFCCQNYGKVNYPLRLILNEIYATVYPSETIPLKYNPSLSHWSQQGILLLNTSLTCQINKNITHYYIWKDFITYVIDVLNTKKEELSFLLLGERAQEFEDLIDSDKHHIIKASHPDIAVLGRKRAWDSEDCFNKLNNTLKNKIIWDIQQNL